MREARIKAEDSGKELKIFFQDEARFGRIDNPRRCWAPKNIRPIVQKQMIREYTYAYGAVCPFDGESCFLILPLMNKKCMKLFLEEISSRFQDNFLLIVCDGASAHKIEENNLPTNVMLIFLPPYSPELNPEENIWDDMREKFFYNFAFKSMDALENRLIHACRFYENNPQTVQSIAAWNWILNC